MANSPAFEMQAREGKTAFLYEIPEPIMSALGVSNRNNTKTQNTECRQDRAIRKHAEWPHDRQPPETSTFYPSPRSSGEKRRKTSPSQESVPNSQTDDEVVKSSLPDAKATEPPGIGPRFSSRLVSKGLQRSTFRAKEHAGVAVRTLESSMHANDLEIEKIKEHRSKLIKEIKRLQDLVSNDDAVVRTYERANMDLKSQKENIQKSAFAMDFHSQC